MVTTAAVLAPHPDVAWCTVDGRVVALQPLLAAGGQPLLGTLNATATAIWQLVDGRRTVAEILAALADRYPDAPAPQREAETLALVERLVAARLLVVHVTAAST